VTKRRTRGDGGLYQRHDHETCPPLDADGERPEHRCRGRWVGTLDVLQDGKRRRKVVYGKTQREARVKLDQAKRDKTEGTIVIASMTTGAWLDYWLDHIATGGSKPLRPQTARGYRSKIDRYMKPTIGNVRLTSLQPEHIRAMQDKMRADGLAEASVRQTHAILKRALKIAVQERKLGSSPADRMDSPGTETAKRQQLTPEQSRTVLACTDDARWWLALLYGFRQGEALGLRWQDVDFDRRLIRVEQSLQTNEDGELIFGPPKSAASRRTMPILPRMEARLRLHHEVSGKPTDGLVFHRDGAPIHPRRDWQAWRDLLDLASTPPWAPIPQVALHAARNSASTLLEAMGVPDRLVMQIMGHSQVQMTHGYQTADLGRITEALAAADDYLALE
jgi:integrase